MNTATDPYFRELVKTCAEVKERVLTALLPTHDVESAERYIKEHRMHIVVGADPCVETLFCDGRAIGVFTLTFGDAKVTYSYREIDS